MNGRIFIIDTIYGGKIRDELIEIGLDQERLICFDLEKYPENRGLYRFLLSQKVEPLDCLVLAINGSERVDSYNHWRTHYRDTRGVEFAGKLFYQQSGWSDFPIKTEGFKSALEISEKNPAIIALIIKQQLGLIPETPDWDTYFMSLVYLVAMRSKDANTHIGAVVVDQHNNVVSTGYNSFPRGIIDSDLKRQVRPEKYRWFNHAEYNAVANAASIGVSLRDCRMYTNGIPCMERCAGAIVNAGITEVIVDADWNQDNGEKWREQEEVTAKLFEEASIQIRYFTGPIISQIQRYRRGRLF